MHMKSPIVAQNGEISMVWSSQRRLDRAGERVLVEEGKAPTKEWKPEGH